MNIYDFDGTIYDGDSCIDIVKYGLKKYPFKTLKCVLKAFMLNNKYTSGLVRFEEVKEALLSFIFSIKNRDKFINDFVSSHMNKIKPWYLSRKNKNDVIITASCDLWIDEFCRRLKINYVIATKIDDNGKIVGKNCKGQEKVKRYRELFPNTIVSGAYSDSLSDMPMLKLAKYPIIVEGNKLISYTEDYNFKIKN